MEKRGKGYARYPHFLAQSDTDAPDRESQSEPVVPTTIATQPRCHPRDVMHARLDNSTYSKSMCHVVSSQTGNRLAFNRRLKLGKEEDCLN